MKKIVVASLTIGLLLVLALAVAQPWNLVDQSIASASIVNGIPCKWSEPDILVVKQQTFLEGKAPSHPPGGYVKLRGPDVNPDVPEDCILTVYDATFTNFGDDVARCDFCGRDSGGSAVFRNQVLFIPPKTTLVLSFPGEGRFLTEGSYVKAGCLEGGPVWASVNGHLECWKSLEEWTEEPEGSTEVQPGIVLPP